MITYWQEENGKLVDIENPNSERVVGGWLEVRAAAREDLRILEETYNVKREHLLDILDPDELSRIEKEDDYLLIIVRVPFSDPHENVNFHTLPLGVIIFPQMIITVCRRDYECLRDLHAPDAKLFSLTDFPSFVIKILSRSDASFLRYLKDINRDSAVIQDELRRSVQNHELIKLLDLETSLVFFTTSLKSNHLLINKLAKTRYLFLDEDRREWLEDVEIDNRQAIEMAETYSDIMSGMMDAFASVISNNLNIVMKRLTVISLVLMVPTLITSFYGMNVRLPFADFGWTGVILVSSICVVLSSMAYLWLTRSDRASNLHRRRIDAMRKT